MMPGSGKKMMDAIVDAHSRLFLLSKFRNAPLRSALLNEMSDSQVREQIIAQAPVDIYKEWLMYIMQLELMFQEFTAVKGSPV